MSTKETLKIAITGHVDHGKSTTIGRILLETRSLPDDKLQEIKKISQQFGKETELAYLTDQLKEERENNLTMDTAEIPFRTRKRDYCLIDTPGHLEFIKNMLTGASHAHAAILIVDASEGMKEQTRRHAYLLKLLSLNPILVLVNKMDQLKFAQKDFENIREEISDFFRTLGISYSFLIPVSARDNVNFSRRSKLTPWYRGPAVLDALDLMTRKTQIKTVPLRFPVQDIYQLENESLIIGRISSGMMQKGQKVTVLPQSKGALIQTIQIFGKNKTRAVQGESIGITLSPALEFKGRPFGSPLVRGTWPKATSRTSTARGESPRHGLKPVASDAVKRGDVICAPGPPSPEGLCFRGNIFWMSQEPLKKNQTVHLRCATQEIPCLIKKIDERIDPATLQVLERDAAQLQKNEAAVMTFSLTSPGVIELFQDIPELGRFTIEYNKSLQGAGTVIEKISS